MKKIFTVILVIYMAFSFNLEGQKQHDSVPVKYGLVLSGGGARGLAHIGLLRMIDSLQIHVDYITGTSMGAVMGGLYSMGYSGDSIKAIVNTVDWSRIISNTHPYNLIHMIERDDYEAYAFEFPIKRGLPTLPNSLIEGQFLMETLQNYTFSSRCVHDFNKLPIPLALVASDIVNGGAVVLDHGYLPLAIRASLSIPGAFSPTIIDGKTLVDGGLDRNFPVEDAMHMGAQYIIGSYTGSRLRTADEIKNPISLLNQAYALSARKDVEKQKGHVNLMLDFSDSLKEYTSADFDKHAQIVAIGEREARKLLPNLLKIKAMQNAQGIKYEHKKIEKISLTIDSINVVDEMNEPLCTQDTRFIEKIIGKDLKDIDNSEALQRITEKIIGYNSCDKVFYTYTQDSISQRNILNIVLKKKPQGTFHAAFHYDNQESAGVILNYTYRDLLLSQSRLSAKLNVAERIKARLNYYKLLGPGGKFWIKGQIGYSVQKSNDLFLKFITQYYNNAEISFRNSNFNASIFTGVSINHNNELRLGIDFTSNKLWQPGSSFSSKLIVEDPFVKSIYRQNHIAANLIYDQNTLDKKYYATKGNNFVFSSKLYLYSHFHMPSAVSSWGPVQKAIYQWLSPDSTLYPIKGKVLHLSLYNHYVRSFSKKFSLHARAFYGINIDLKKSFKDNFHFDSYVYLNQKFYMGGYANFNPDNHQIFTGLRSNEYPVNNIASLYLGAQYNPLGRLYVTPSISLGSELGSFNPFTAKSDFIYGYGLDIDYMSLLGPIKLSFNKNNLFTKSRLFFSFGYAF